MKCERSNREIYPTDGHAKAHLTMLAESGHKARSYRCHYCGMWHVGVDVQTRQDVKPNPVLKRRR